MDRKCIVAMPGDGIGKVLLPEALRVLDAAGFKADFIPADIGWEFVRAGDDVELGRGGAHREAPEVGSL